MKGSFFFSFIITSNRILTLDTDGFIKQVMIIGEEVGIHVQNKLNI